MHRGFITIHRKILDNPVVFKDADHVAVWVYLLLNATHKKYPVLFQGRSIELQPGQLITGRLSIADKLKINQNKVQRILEMLKNEQLIEQQTSNQNRLITIVSWGKYQTSEQQNEQRVNNDRTTGEQRVNTNNNVNNVNNVEEQNNISTDLNKSVTQPPLFQNETIVGRKSNASLYTEEFESFWAVYPSRVGKADAAKKFHKALKAVDLNTLIEAVKQYCKSKKVLDGFVCNPATWLHQERWKDQSALNLGEVGMPPGAVRKTASGWWVDKDGYPITQSEFDGRKTQ